MGKCHEDHGMCMTMRAYGKAKQEVKFAKGDRNVPSTCKHLVFDSSLEHILCQISDEAKEEHRGKLECLSSVELAQRHIDCRIILWRVFDINYVVCALTRRIHRNHSNIIIGAVL